MRTVLTRSRYSWKIDSTHIPPDEYSTASMLACVPPPLFLPPRTLRHRLQLAHQQSC